MQRDVAPLPIPRTLIQIIELMKAAFQLGPSACQVHSEQDVGKNGLQNKTLEEGK